tara:strand:+ start:187 stop:2520 length:2334 start_codon:yes stop_codon:yes gene_type:complete
MALKIYKRIGIRRDNNLSDLSNVTESLNNLLDGLATGSDETFIKQDLDCIKNIFSEGMTSSQYKLIGGSAQTYTDTQGNTKTLKPLVTFQNRLDIAELFSGEPRLHGGDGLTASYYNEDQVQLNEGLYGGPLTGEPFATNQFWEDGNFAWDRKIHPSSANINGGIQWEGWFVPTQTGTHSFYIDSPASTTFEFQEESWGGSTSNPGVAGTYKEYSFIGISSSLPIQAVSSGNVIALQNISDVKYIGIGQSVGLTVDNINSTESNTLTIEDYSPSNGTITLTEPTSGDAVTGSIDAGTLVDFSKGINDSVRTRNPISYQLEAYSPYRIRMRYFVPQEYGSTLSDRSFDFNFTPPNGSTSTDIRYNYLYNLNYDFSDSVKGTFNKYYDNSILFGGGTVGGTSKSNYVEIKSTKKVDVRYNPLNITVTNSSSGNRPIEFASKSCSTTLNSGVIPLTDTTNIEVGNYVYDDTNIANESNKIVSDGTRVKDVIINQAIILDTKSPKAGTATLKFIDHRGHIKRIAGLCPSGSDTITMINSGDVTYNRTNLKKGMIVVVSNNLEKNTKITDVESGTAQEIKIGPVSTGVILQGPYYVYESQGLTNTSLKAFCFPSTDIDQNKCVSVTTDIPAGSTTLTVDSIADIDIGDRVLGYYFATGTKVTSSSGNTIQIDTATDKLIKSGNNFTVTSNQVASDDKSLCCPPKDTSPPFAANDDGMETVSDYKILEFSQGNVVFDTFRATVDSSNTYTASSTSDYTTLLGTSTNKRIRLQTASGEFKLLTS